LSQQADLISIVESDYRGASRVMNHFEISDIAVGQLHALDVHFNDAAFEDRRGGKQFTLHGIKSQSIGDRKLS
jgi:hypothetical protein